MGCYYCPLDGADERPERGMCKECFALACGPSDNYHGEKCASCGAFICRRDRDPHAKKHGIPLSEAFPASSIASASLVANWLEKPVSKRALMATKYGIELSAAFEDKAMEKTFRSLYSSFAASKPAAMKIDRKKLSKLKKTFVAEAKSKNIKLNIP